MGMARGCELGRAFYQKRLCAQSPFHSACASNGCSCPHDERDQKYWQTHVPLKKISWVQVTTIDRIFFWHQRSFVPFGPWCCFSGPLSPPSFGGGGGGAETPPTSLPCFRLPCKSTLMHAHQLNTWNLRVESPANVLDCFYASLSVSLCSQYLQKSIHVESSQQRHVVADVPSTTTAKVRVGLGLRHQWVEPSPFSCLPTPLAVPFQANSVTQAAEGARGGNAASKVPGWAGMMT